MAVRMAANIRRHAGSKGTIMWSQREIVAHGTCLSIPSSVAFPVSQGNLRCRPTAYICSESLRAEIVAGESMIKETIWGGEGGRGEVVKEGSGDDSKPVDSKKEKGISIKAVRFY